MFTAAFWKDAAVRAVKTFAQAEVALLGANSVGLLDAPWGASLSAAGMAALLSVLTSVGVGSVAAARAKRNAA